MAQAAAHLKPKIPLPRALSKLAVKRVTAGIEALLDAVEALVDSLDGQEPDSDHEDNGDNEPSLAAFGGNDDDREGDEHDGREPEEEL